MKITRSAASRAKPISWVTTNMVIHVQHLAHHLGIQGGGWLVKKHDLGPHGEGPGDGDALLLSAGELVGVGVPLILQTHGLQQLHGLALALLLIPLFNQGGGQHDVVQHRQVGKEVKLLEHHTHAQEHLVGAPGVGADQIHIVEEDLSPCGLFQQVQAAQKGGLAAAGGAHNGHHLAGLDLDVDALEHLVLAKALLKPFDADHTHTVSAPRK